MFKNLSQSAKSLRDTRVVCICAIMVAMYVVLDLFQIQLAPQIVISFSFIPIAVSGWLFGIVPAMVVGGVSDILSFVIKPTGSFFPGFTVTAILTGAVFGLILYGANGKSVWIKSAVSKLAVTAILNIGLNTVWTSMLTGKAYLVLLWGRIIKNTVMLPVEIALLAVIITLLSRHKIINR